jgi:hypothetical protein
MHFCSMSHCQASGLHRRSDEEPAPDPELYEIIHTEEQRRKRHWRMDSKVPRGHDSIGIFSVLVGENIP